MAWKQNDCGKNTNCKRLAMVRKELIFLNNTIIKSLMLKFI
jgi:hypothetical protein